ncbi:MAG TPA: class II aldolase/adducin family protein [Gaiellaceae bacterium]|nr:class II aldolase/adducin family protein [Gaiellaceae bacterium]
MQQGDATLREELAAATRVLGRHEMIGMFGHISVMTDDPQRYLICPGAGMRKDRCRASDIIELDLDAEFKPGLPLELYMHAAAHRQQPERIRSLVHVHSRALTALSVLADVPTDLLMIHAGFWPEQMPLWDDPDLVRSHELANKMMDIIGDESMLLLRWHGAVIVGSTLKETLFRTLLAETHAQQWLTALAHGQPLQPIPRDVSREYLYDEFLSPFTHNLHWNFSTSFVPEAPGARP